MNPPTAMREFRTTLTDDGILHLIFDMPGRSMNVFSNAAIHEIEGFADWLATSDVRGVVVSSGKKSAFCAGADLAELSVAYDMIMSAPPADRTRVARDHFAPIGRAFRKLETAGKPVAVAINGLALGGGCEFALACHHRVLADTPRTALGLPESLVGLFPGAGGTQRLPRYIGIERALPVLLEGARFSPQQALDVFLAHEVVPAGEEIAAAERWIRTSPQTKQPWDRPEWLLPPAGDVAKTIAKARSNVLAETGGHYPAPLAILDCIERGFPEPMDRALEIETDIFADLIKRPEPRNMIQTLFLGKQEYDKGRKAGELPPQLGAFLSDVRRSLASVAEKAGPVQAKDALRFAGFANDQGRCDSGAAAGSKSLWIDDPESAVEKAAAEFVASAVIAAAAYANAFKDTERRLADYAAVTEAGFPSYLGGPFAMLDYLGIERIRILAGE